MGHRPRGRRAKALLLLLALPVAHGAEEEAATVRVRLRLKGSGDPLAAEVRVGEVAARTDARGRVTLVVPPGAHTLTVHADGVVAAPRPLDLRPGEAREVDLFLLGPEVVEVVEPGRPRGAGEQVLTQETLRLVPGAFGDPVRALEVTPAVGQVRVGEPGLTVRGSEPTHTAVRVDGIDVPWLFHWYVLRSVVNPAVLDRVTFRPGGLAASEGGFAQGLVEVSLEDRASGPGVHGRVTVDVMDGSLALKGRVGDWHLSASGRTSWLGELSTIPALVQAAAQGDRVPYTALRWSDYHARALGTLGPHEVTLTALGAVDVLRVYGQVDPTEGEVDRARLPYDTRHPLARNFHRLSLRWRSTSARLEHATTLTVGHDRDASIFDLWFRPAGVELSHVEGPTMGALSSWRAWLRHHQRWAIHPRWAALVGLDADGQLARAEDWARLDPETLAPERDRQHLLTAAPWVAFEHTAARTWLSVGARGAWHLLTAPRPVFVLEPRLALRQALSEVTTLTGSVGGTSQRPPAWRTSPALGAPEVGVVRSWQATVGVEARWRGGVELDLTAYGTWYPSLVVSRTRLHVGRRDPSDPMIEVWSDLAFEDARGASTGLEAALRWTPGPRGLLGVAVSAGHAWRWAGGERWPADKDRPFAATVWGGWRPGKGWALSGRAQVGAGFPAAPALVLHDLYADRLLAGGDPRRTSREPWSHQLDLRVAKTFVAKRATWTLFLDAFNVTNQPIPLATRFDPERGEVVPYLYLPAIPSLGLDVVF